MVYTLWKGLGHFDFCFWVYSLTENKGTFRNQIDSFSNILSHSLTHNEIFGSVSHSKVWNWVNLTNKSALIFRQTKDSKCESTWPRLRCGQASVSSIHVYCDTLVRIALFERNLRDHLGCKRLRLRLHKIQYLVYYACTFVSHF